MPSSSLRFLILFAATVCILCSLGSQLRRFYAVWDLPQYRFIHYASWRRIVCDRMTARVCSSLSINLIK